MSYVCDVCGSVVPHQTKMMRYTVTRTVPCFRVVGDKRVPSTRTEVASEWRLCWDCQDDLKAGIPIREMIREFALESTKQERARQVVARVERMAAEVTREDALSELMGVKPVAVKVPKVRPAPAPLMPPPNVPTKFRNVARPDRPTSY